MKPILASSLFLLSVMAPLPARTAPPVSASTEPYEIAPVLQASAILRPNYLRGPYHRVRETVPTYSGANRYVIDSDFGVFRAEGNALLMQRVAEIGAIALLKEISETDEYKRAVVNAAKSPVELARHLVKDPVGTVSSVPKGVWKLINRAGQGIKEAADQRERSEGEDSMAESLIGVSKAKRELAAQFGVNPYSTNEVLQTELNRVAWTSVAGGATVRALTLALSGGAAIAATSVQAADTSVAALRDTAPLDLRQMNEKRLLAMDIPQETVTAFLGNPAFSPAYQTYLTAALASLEGVDGRSAYLRAAADNAEEELDAIFFTHTARILAGLNGSDVPLARITTLGGLPIAVARDGRMVVALEWDYAVWNQATDRFTQRLREFAARTAPNAGGDLPTPLLALSGDVSPQLRQVLSGRNVEIRTRVEPGPLR